MTISEGTLVQGDDATPELFVVRSGKRVLIPSLHDFHQTGFSMGDVQVIPSAELAKLPLAADGASALDGGLHADLVVDQTLALDLDTDLGAGHFMTTHGALRKT